MSDLGDSRAATAQCWHGPSNRPGEAVPKAMTPPMSVIASTAEPGWPATVCHASVRKPHVTGTRSVGVWHDLAHSVMHFDGKLWSDAALAGGEPAS